MARYIGIEAEIRTQGHQPLSTKRLGRTTWHKHPYLAFSNVFLGPFTCWSKSTGASNAASGAISRLARYPGNSGMSVVKMGTKTLPKVRCVFDVKLFFRTSTSRFCMDPVHLMALFRSIFTANSVLVASEEAACHHYRIFLQIFRWKDCSSLDLNLL